MTTDLISGSVPSSYREIFNICSPNGEPITKDVFKALLIHSQLPVPVMKHIWDECSSPQGNVSRTHLYKALAFIALAQNGKEPSDKLLENFTGKELPTPNLGDLSSVKKLNGNSIPKSNPTILDLAYSDILKIDTITVDLVPEKKGIFLKHSEYLVSSRRFGSNVRRRYNDFVALYELLLVRFPYRLIPKLPPKKIVSDSHFLESRRRALQRWLTLVARHPILSQSTVGLIAFFLTDASTDLQHRIREAFRRQPDEFTTSELAGKAKELVPPDTQTEFSASREQLLHIWNGVRRLQQICERGAARGRSLAQDAQELSAELRDLASDPCDHSQWATGGNKAWADIKRGFGFIAKEFSSLSNKALKTAIREEDSVCEQLCLLNDALAAHASLCERLERGVVHDHQRALQHMLSLKKRQIQGVIKGTDAESIEQLESKMMEQETVISNMELRTAFSLHCVHMETQLVHVYLEILATVFNNMVAAQIKAHTELADVWKNIQPTIVSCLPERSILSQNGTGSDAS